MEKRNDLVEEIFRSRHPIQLGGLAKLPASATLE
jgi:hypothetical protein